MSQMQDNEQFEPLDTLLALAGPVDCVAPDDIDHEDLLRHARGAALSASAQNHIDECGYCTNLLSEYRAIATEPTRIGRWPLFGGLAGLAAAAAAVFAITTTSEIATYQVAEVTGVVQQQRSVDAPQEIVFAPNSQVKVVLTPEVSGSASSQVLVFGVSPDGRLRPATADVQRNKDGEFVSYLVTGTGSGLFGTEAGERQFAIHIASSKIDPLGLAVETARAKYDGQWLVIDARYLGGPE